MSDQHYTVLARKYRPQNFDDLVGQEAMVKTISNSIALNRIAHAFILTGIRGIGKTTTARIIARALNCVGADGKSGPTTAPCGVCSNCVSIKEDRNMDVIEMDAASRTGVDDIREIIDNVAYLPVNSRYKIYIIDEVHMLSKNAFNALLKTLEEPPAHVKFIFATTEIRKIPVTIISRCMRFDLRRLDIAELSNHLKNIATKESVEVEDAALALISSAAEGSVRDALSLLDQAIAHSESKVTEKIVFNMIGLADKNNIAELFECLAAGDIKNALAKFKNIYDLGVEPLLVMQDLLEVNYLITKYKINKDNSADHTVSEILLQKIRTLSDSLSISYLAICWQMLLKGIEDVKIASNAFMAAEMVLIRIAYLSDLPPPDKLLKDYKETSENSSGISDAKVIAAPNSLETVSENSFNGFSSFVELADFVKSKGEILLYSYLKNDCFPVKLKTGILELRLSEAVPKDFTNKLSEFLKNATATNWVVVVSKEQGEKSLAEQEKDGNEKIKQQIVTSSDVKKIFELFPNASISAIK